MPSPPSSAWRPPEPPAATARRSSRAVVLTVAGAFFLLLLDSSILNTSLPRVAQSMGVQPLALSPTITGYLLASVAAMPLSNWLCGKFGIRRVYLLSIAVFTLASAACGGSASLWQLVAARVVQGAAAGMMLTVGRTLAVQDADKSELLSITSLLVWPALMAPVLGPPLGGWITTYFSWRWNFFLNVPMGLMAMLLILRFVPRDTARDELPMDWLGAFYTVGGLATFFGGLELMAQATEGGGHWGLALSFFALGAVLLALAWRHLVRSPHPLIGLAPLKVKTFAISTFSGGIFSSLCLHATPYLLPLMFQLAFGATAAAAGAMLIPYFLGNLTMKTVTTPLLRRFGFKRVLLVDGVFCMLPVAVCGFLGAQTPWLLMSALLFFAGATRSLLFTALNTLCYADVEPRERGTAATLSSVSMLLAQSLGIVVSTLMLAAAKASDGRATLELGDFRLAFFGVAAIGLLSVTQYARLSRHAGEEVSGSRRPERTTAKAEATR
ncbi:MAG: MFS transporter [Variovorax sp.]